MATTEMHLLDNSHIFHKPIDGRKFDDVSDKVLNNTRPRQPGADGPALRSIPFDPDRQKYPHGARMIATDGPMEGKIVRLLFVRAQVEDCDDYDSYAVGSGDFIRCAGWISESHLMPL